MAEFIANPRRAPRAPARCRTAVVTRTASIDAETEDIGAYGCQVVSPKGVTKDEPVQVTIANDRVAEPLHVAARIAWVSARFPWRVGIAFDESALPETTAWFEKLVAAHPGMRELRRLPSRIAMDAAVYLGTPPRLVVDFNEDEASLLRAIGSGARVDELMARFRNRGPRIERALFSLIARSAVTLVRGHAAHPSSWKPVLDEVEASLAADSLGTGALPETLAAPPDEPRAEPRAPAPLPFAPPPATRRGPELSPFGTPPHDPARQLELRDDPGVALDVEAPAAPAPAARATPADLDRFAAELAAQAAAAPDAAGKGTGWRKPARKRTGEAQVLFDRARSEFGGGNVNGAIALLRRALALAPGDPEIAQVLGNLAFRDRDPGAR